MINRISSYKIAIEVAERQLQVDTNASEMNLVGKSWIPN